MICISDIVISISCRIAGNISEKYTFSAVAHSPAVPVPFHEIDFQRCPAGVLPSIMF